MGENGAAAEALSPSSSSLTGGGTEGGDALPADGAGETAAARESGWQGNGGLGNWKRADHNQGAWSTAAPSHNTSRAA
jgi:hypothetical protein